MKRVLKILGFIILVALVVVVAFFWRDAAFDKYDVTIEEDKIPKFTQVDLPFSHEYNSGKSLPIAPSCLIDINNDYVDEVFFGGGMDQEDKLFAFRGGKFVDVSAEVNLPKKGTKTTSLGAVSADFDDNGFTDLIISREDGLYLYYNSAKGFTQKAIKTPVNEKSTPTGITVGDIDKDGDLDIFLATYIKKELMEGQSIFMDKTYGSTSELLLNDGDENFTSITKSAGLDYIHNTFTATLVDIDNDTWLDLVVVHDTGEVRTYRNNGDLTYTRKDNPLSSKYGFPMGVAVGDYNNDGLIDFMFSNTGSTLPRFVAKGDIEDASKFNEKWLLFENTGNFTFKDVAEETKIAGYEFSWGCVFADMNNDGLQDLIVAENYVALPPNMLFRLPSRLLIQKEDHTFGATESASGVKNPHYAMTPLVSDFDKDGYLDLIWANIDSPSLAYLNEGGKLNCLGVDVGEQVASIGARVTVETATKKLTDHHITGEGLASDQTAYLHFGLGEEEVVKRVIVNYVDGSEKIIENPAVNTILKVEKSATAEAENNTNDEG